MMKFDFVLSLPSTLFLVSPPLNTVQSPINPVQSILNPAQSPLNPVQSLLNPAGVNMSTPTGKAGPNIR